MYIRPVITKLIKRFSEPRRFIQVLAGPRQVGKTTLALQIEHKVSVPIHFASADEPTLRDSSWLAQQWEIGRLMTERGKKHQRALLILDEVQKVNGWSETVKRLWDEDSRAKRPLHVLLLGSVPLLIQHGLSESLAGRFELTHAAHWSFSEMHEAFRWKIDQYVYFGGYPGAAGLIKDENRWKQYIRDSLIETTISRDVLLMTRVDKPALLRRLFYVACEYSGQVVSYQKMLGQLHDAGNTTTLANYLDLLAGAGMIKGIQKFAGGKIRQRGSSPKLMTLNTGLMSVHFGLSFIDARRNGEYWGRLVESCVGAHLLNQARGKSFELFYWQDRNVEVDFILKSGKHLVALEVKSNRRRTKITGLEAFAKLYHPKRILLVGGQGIPIEEFLQMDVATFFR